jgi:hypothetical protein
MTWTPNGFSEPVRPAFVDRRSELWGRRTLLGGRRWELGPGTNGPRLALFAPNRDRATELTWPLGGGAGGSVLALPGDRLLGLQHAAGMHESIDQTFAVFDVEKNGFRQDLSAYADLLHAAPQNAGTRMSLRVSPDGSRIAGWRRKRPLNLRDPTDPDTEEREPELAIVDVATGRVLTRLDVANGRDVSWASAENQLLVGAPLERLDAATGRVVARGGEGRLPIELDEKHVVAVRGSALLVLDRRWTVVSTHRQPFHPTGLGTYRDPRVGALIIAIGEGASLPMMRFVRVRDGRALNVAWAPGKRQFWFADDGRYFSPGKDIIVGGKLFGTVVVGARDPSLWNDFWSGAEMPEFRGSPEKPPLSLYPRSFPAVAADGCERASETCFAWTEP